MVQLKKVLKLPNEACQVLAGSNMQGRLLLKCRTQRGVLRFGDISIMLCESVVESIEPVRLRVVRYERGAVHDPLFKSIFAVIQML